MLSAFHLFAARFHFSLDRRVSLSDSCLSRSASTARRSYQCEIPGPWLPLSTCELTSRQPHLISPRLPSSSCATRFSRSRGTTDLTLCDFQPCSSRPKASTCSPRQPRAAHSIILSFRRRINLHPFGTCPRLRTSTSIRNLTHLCGLSPRPKQACLARLLCDL